MAEWYNSLTPEEKEKVKQIVEDYFASREENIDEKPREIRFI